MCFKDDDDDQSKKKQTKNLILLFRLIEIGAAGFKPVKNGNF